MQRALLQSLLTQPAVAPPAPPLANPQPPAGDGDSAQSSPLALRGVETDPPADVTDPQDAFKREFARLVAAGAAPNVAAAQALLAVQGQAAPPAQPQPSLPLQQLEQPDEGEEDDEELALALALSLK